jgi:hypothetical protein
MTVLLALRTDFNDLYDGRAAVLLEALNGFLPQIGSTVLLYDADDSTCLGRVVEIDVGLIYVEPDWDTWKSDRVDFPDVDLVEALRASVRATSEESNAATKGFAKELTQLSA